MISKLETLQKGLTSLILELIKGNEHKSARQKIYGIGYSLLVFVYKKTDDHKNKTDRLNFIHTVFIEKEYTADLQTTKWLIQMLENEANIDDLVAFMTDRNLPLDEIEANKIAEELLKNKLKQGYLLCGLKNSKARGSGFLQTDGYQSMVLQKAANRSDIAKILAGWQHVLK